MCVCFFRVSSHPAYSFLFIFGLQPIGSVEDWFNALVIKDSGILYEDPFVQVRDSSRAGN